MRFFRAVRPPDGLELPAPEFPSGIDWLGVPFLRMDRLMGRHAVLVEFWDFARVNSLRTLPYLVAWHERYSDAGLQVIGGSMDRGFERLRIALSVSLVGAGLVPVLAEKAGATVRQKVTMQQGIPIEKAKDIVKKIKDSKVKVQASIQGDTVRVSGKDRDTLQQVIALLRASDFGIDLQFTNYRTN